MHGHASLLGNIMAWKLSKIKTKVRRLTGRPSANQLSESDLQDYINEFYQNDLMALLNLKEQEDYFTFATLKEVAEYSNEPDNYVLDGPAYVNGDIVELFKDPKCFYERFGVEFQPEETIATGDGSTTNFTGTLNESPVDVEQFVCSDGVETFVVKAFPLISAATVASNAAITTSSVHSLATGDTVMIRNIQSGMTELNNKISPVTVTSTTSFTLDDVDSSSFTTYEGGGEIVPLSSIKIVGSRGGSGKITATSGAFDITFNSAPADGASINASYGIHTTGTPSYILFTGNKFVLRAVPDDVYQVRIAVTKRPKALTDDDNTLQNDNWGKIVAYGAAIDILSDFGQQEIAATLQPQYRQMLQNAQAISIRDALGDRSVPSF
jgi:hypothetical protein